MIVKELLRQEWAKTFRAPGFYKNLTVNILIGFFALYMGLMLLFVGILLRKMLLDALPGYSPVEAFGGLMLYALIGGLGIRFLMQQLNTFNLPPYQVLPIKRNTLVNYLLLKPLFNPVNYLTLLIVGPFAAQSAIAGDLSGLQAWGLVASVVFLIWFNSLFAAFLKRKFGSNLLGVVTVAAVISVIAALEYFKLFSLFDLSQQIFSFVASQPFGALPVFAFPLLAFALNKWFFSQNYYPERFNEKMPGRKVLAGDFSFMSRLGKIGELISLQLRLILRHKRTKSVLTMAFVFLAYGLLFYPSKSIMSNMPMMFFVAMFVTGGLMLMYGQWIISWDGGHFDYLMTRKIDTHTYIQANYVLLIGFNIISFVLTTPYFFFGQKIVFLHLFAFLYNMGVNAFIYLLLAPFNTKRLDLSKGSAMNYQGTTYKSFLFVLPLMFFPMVFIGIFSAFHLSDAAVIILGVLGLLGLIFHKQLLVLCERNFLRRKYVLCDELRKKE